MKDITHEFQVVDLDRLGRLELGENHRVVVLDWQKNGWSHLVSRNVEHLHQFAEEIGLSRIYFENHRIPHYDLKGMEIVRKAIQNGAIPTSSKALVTFFRTGVLEAYKDVPSGFDIVDAGTRHVASFPITDSVNNLISEDKSKDNE